MAGRTLCASDCAVQAQCQRHAACPQAYPIHPHWQSYALWQPERGRECEGFAGIAISGPKTEGKEMENLVEALPIPAACRRFNEAD